MKKSLLIGLLGLAVNYEAQAMLAKSVKAASIILCAFQSVHTESSSCIASEFKTDIVPAHVDHKIYPELAKFIKKYRCSKEIEELKSIDIYFKGSEIDRIKNAERLKRAIQEKKLDRVIVPEKCLFLTKDKSRLVVASKAIYYVEEKIISDEAVKEIELQISQLQKDPAVNLFDIDLPYKSRAKGHNTIYTDEKHLKVAIIDTEDITFRKRGISTNSSYDAEIGIDFTAVENELHRWRDENNTKTIDASDRVK
ncbi:hypothetical protein EBR77_02975 [bacterium]|nr:hypothetical protein [bacterium]